MTPFMLRVAEIVGTPQDQLPELDELAPMPETRISRRIATGTGADRQVAIRSLAEQLVSCLLYTSPSPRDRTRSRMPSSA